MTSVDESGSTAEVVDITIDRTGGMTIAWSDGFEGSLSVADLRDACPCAACRGRREQGRPVTTSAPEHTRIVDAELVGAWGLSLRWHDGHDTGIYPWDRLRAWMEADADHR